MRLDELDEMLRARVGARPMWAELVAGTIETGLFE
jgi:hypothetical protein